jgi:hypothetical protein
MAAELHQVPGMTVYPSQANFILVKLPPGTDGGLLRDYLLSQHGVLVRECGNKLGITSQFVRLVVRPRADVQRLLTGLYGYLGIRIESPLEAGMPGGYSELGGYSGRREEFAAQAQAPAPQPPLQSVPTEGAWVAEALRSQRVPSDLR